MQVTMQLVLLRLAIFN